MIRARLAACLLLVCVIACGGATNDVEPRSGEASQTVAASPVSLPLASPTVSSLSPPTPPNSQKDNGATLKEGEVLTRHVQFPRGRSSAVFKNQWVVRTTRHEYLVEARAGQKMTVRITSVEKNASFVIYRENDPTYLKGADGTTHWSGHLPETGNYIIEVGADRGNATYTLSVTVQ